VPPITGLAVTALSVVLLLATLVARGRQGVHRWIQLGPLTFHVASLSLPLVLIELDRLLRYARFAIAIGAILTIAVILAVQPDAGQASAFAGSAIVLLICDRTRVSVTVTAALALIALAASALLRSDPLAPVPYVEEIAIRISHRGAAWEAAVVLALALLIVPFGVPMTRGRSPAGLAVAVYLVLSIAASCWGNFPVPILGYGMSPIIGYFAGWAWLRSVVDHGTSRFADRASA